MTLTRGFVRNAVTTPLDARLMDMAQIVGNNDGSPRPGVLDGDGRTLVTALATMNVAVGQADFVTTKGTADGVAIFTNDGTVNVAIAAAPASNSRITVIWVKHNDNTTGDANSLPVFGTTDGAAAASPTKPAIPTGALELATLRVYSGTTAANGGANVLTNTYQMTASRGGMVVVRTLAELTAWTTPQLSQRVFNMADKRIYTRHAAGMWVPDRAAFFANRANAQALGTVGWFGLGPSFGAAGMNDIGVWTGAPNGILQIQYTGIYRVSLDVKLSSPSNPWAMQVTNNSTSPDVNVVVEAFVNSPTSRQSASDLVVLNAGDVLRGLIYTSVANSVAAGQLAVELIALT